MNSRIPARASPEVIGLEQDAARDLIEASGLRFRVRSEDGKQYLGTLDLDVRRCNVHLVDGKVVRTEMG